MKNLDGIYSIWNFVFTAKNEEVVTFAVELLADLYVHISDQISEQQ